METVDIPNGQSQEIATPKITQPQNNKLLFMTIGILAILTIAAGSWYFMILQKKQSATTQTNQIIQPTIQPTQSVAEEFAGWKTHDNRQFTLRYPLDWTMNEFNNHFSITKSGQYGIKFTIYVDMLNIPQNMTLKSYIDSGKLDPQNGQNYLEKVNPGGEIFSLKQTSDHSLYKTYEPSVWTSAQGIIVRFIEDMSKNQYAMISMEPFNSLKGTIPEEDKYEKIYSKILSTFRFINQNQKTDTANWKTYELNSLTGFNKAKILYPDSWSVKEVSNVPDTFFEIDITKDNTHIGIRQAAFGAAECTYSDTPQSDGGPSTYYDEYIEINKGTSLWRMSKVTYETTKNTYHICEGSNTTKQFVSVTSIGNISVTDDKTNTSATQEINQILKNIKIENK